MVMYLCPCAGLMIRKIKDVLAGAHLENEPFKQITLIHLDSIIHPSLVIQTLVFL